VQYPNRNLPPVGDIPRIGPRSIPDDANLKELLSDLIKENSLVLIQKGTELIGVIRDFEKEGEPREFAYGKLLNYLNAQDFPEVVYLCAAAMWNLYGYRNDGTQV
jgi:hypothetical protein